ncbi:acyltransferase [Candidatus Oscillochloris fontis]|uniref:acyltransferase n=1 Tax=Candidatus Oscillochloris fontis TaxID=2496868 RepID=UPI00101BAE6C|nr:acyltransferase [Candidatus Oscillochloris fontis]
MNESLEESLQPNGLGVQAEVPRQDYSLKRLWDDGRAVLRARWYLRDATLLGWRVRLWGRATVDNQGSMRIGNRVRLVSTIVPLELATGKQGLLEIGESTFINYGCSIAATQFVRIGPCCNIGTYVIMMDNDFHRIEPERREEMPPSAPIILEENVWLGARVIVLRGVTIGAGSVVAAGSVVTRDIPPRSLAAGLPARVIRHI